MRRYCIINLQINMGHYSFSEISKPHFPEARVCQGFAVKYLWAFLYLIRFRFEICEVGSVRKVL